MDKSHGLIIHAVNTLLGVCDGANSRDGSGFNGMDAKFVRDVMNRDPKWFSLKMWAALHKMLSKYNRQLSGLGISYSEIPTPTEGYVKATIGTGQATTTSQASTLPPGNGGTGTATTRTNGITIGVLGARFTITCGYDTCIPGTSVPIRADVRLRFEGARWDKTRKVWTVPSGLDTVDRLETYKPRWTEEAIKYADTLNALIKRPAIQLPAEEDPRWDIWKFKTKPMIHQLESLDFTLTCGEGSGNFSWMGTGKTKAMIDWAFTLAKQGKIKRLLILCPSPIMGNEEKEIKIHGWDTVSYAVVIAKGTADRRAWLIQKLSEDNVDLQIAIINYEATITEKVQDALEKFVSGAPTAAVADESTWIKNHAAQRSKNAYALGDLAKFRMIMTGTPIAERPTDAFGQMYFMDKRIFGDSWIAFRSRYCVMGGFEGKEIISYQNMDDFKRRLWCRSICYDKSVLGLPERLGALDSPNGPNLREFEMTKEMKENHKVMARDLLVELDGNEFTAPIVLTKFLRLQEITSGYLKQGDLVTRLPGKNPKAELLVEILEESQDHKVVVWCKEHEEIKIASEAVDGLGLVCFTLDGSTADKHGTVEAFKAHPKRAVLVAQVQTGGIGFTMTEATMAVYFSNTWPLTNRQQSEDRLHRKGQTNHVTYYDLVAKDSIDLYILETLKRKNGVSVGIMDIKEALKQWQ